MAKNLMPTGRLFLSDAEVEEVARSKSLYRFLSMYAKGSRTFDFFDFTENAAIADYPFAVANSAGTGAASFAIPSTKVKNGVITGAPGTTDDGSISLIGQLIHRGADNAGMEARIRVDVVASDQNNIEVGFIDAVPGSNGPGVSDVDTPAATFTNGAVFTIDGDQTLKTLAAVSKGNAASQGVVATSMASVASPLTAFTADQYVTFSVQLVQAGSSSSIAQALFFINGVLVANHSPAAGAVNGATLLAPWIYHRTRNTTAKVLTVDYIARWGDRNA